MSTIVKFLLFLILFFCVVKHAVASSTALSLAPHTFEISGVSGERIKKTVKIRNNGDFSIPLTLKVSNFDAEDESGKMITVENNNQENNFSSWFSLEKKDLIIDPGKTEKLDFSIDIPQNVSDGGYYGIILLETAVSSLYLNETKTQILPSTGILVMLSIGEEEEGGQISIEDYQISESSRMLWAEKSLNFLAGPFMDEENKIAVVENSQPDISITFKNNGTRHIKLDNEIKILGLSQKEKDKIDLPNVTILPGKTRKISWQKEAVQKENAETEKEKEGLTKGVMIGPAKARLIVEEEQKEKLFEEERTIFVFPWKKLSVLILFLGGVVFLWRKRKTKSALWITFLQNSFTNVLKNAKTKAGKIAEIFLIRKINKKNYDEKKKN